MQGFIERNGSRINQYTLRSKINNEKTKFMKLKGKREKNMNFL